MSFNIVESSVETGQPIEFYRIALGVETFNYTSAEDIIVDGPNTYTPAEISRTEILMGVEQRQDVLTVTMPTSLAPVNTFGTIIPGQKMSLTIFRQHSTDGGSPQTVTIFKGNVRSVGFTDDGEKADLSVISLANPFGSEIPRFTFSSLCPHVLYDGRCGVLEGDFKFTGNVTVESGITLTIPGLNGEVDGFYDSGFIQRGTSDWRLVLSHSGNDIDILLPFPGGIVGEEMDVFAGCDHTIATCKTKFNIVVNFGGFAFVPLRDIFKTGIR